MALETFLFSDHMFHITLQIIGLVIMVFGAGYVLSIRKYVKSSKFEKSWNIIFAFAVMFIMMYMSSILLFFIHDLEPLVDAHLILSVTLLVGAIFMVYITHITKDMLKDIQHSLSNVKAMRTKQKELVKSIIDLTKKKK